MSRNYKDTLIKVLHLITHPIFYPLLKFFLRYKAVGFENIRGIVGPAIFVSNHGSYFDPAIVDAGIPWYSHFRPIRYLAHDELFDDKFINFILRIYGSFPGKAHHGDGSALRRPSELLAQGMSIGIFKEWCYDVEPAKGNIPKMIVALSLQNNVPIIPVFTFGIYDGGITWSTFLMRKRTVRVAYGEPIYPDKNMDEENLSQLMEASFAKNKIAFINSLHEDEKTFWSSYARFYAHLEKSDPYNDLLREVGSLLPDRLSGKWLDLGSGSGKIVDLLVKKANKDITEIHSSDLDSLMLKQISERFVNEKIVRVRHLDLSNPIELSDEGFDGITANLVLPYVVHHNGEIGKASLTHLLESIHKTLRPGGVLLWSTPKQNVSFFRVFLHSWRNVFDVRHLENLFYGPTIFWHAIKIQRKGVSGIYSFLKPQEVREILEKIGFTDIETKRSMADQVDIFICKKK